MAGDSGLLFTCLFAEVELLHLDPMLLPIAMASALNFICGTWIIQKEVQEKQVTGGKKGEYCEMKFFFKRNSIFLDIGHFKICHLYNPNFSHICITTDSNVAGNTL